MTDTDLLSRLEEKRFWQSCTDDLKGATPDFLYELFNTPAGEIEQLHCSTEFLAVASKMYEYQSRDIPDISSCATPDYVPGVLNSHIVECTINGVPMFLELPEVRIQLEAVGVHNYSVDATPYVSQLEGIAKVKRATGIDIGYQKALMRSLAYCSRLDIGVAPIYANALKQGYKQSTLDKALERVAAIQGNIATVDMWLADWVEKASAYCNTPAQLNVLRWIYIRAAMFNTKQPRICKSTIALELGNNRNVVIRLFKRLKDAGLLVESPETYSYDYIAGAPKSDARMVNLDTNEPNRWEDYLPLPTINRSTAPTDIEDISSCATPKTIVKEDVGVAPIQPDASDEDKRNYSSEWIKEVRFGRTSETLNEFTIRKLEKRKVRQW